MRIASRGRTKASAVALAVALAVGMVGVASGAEAEVEHAAHVDNTPTRPEQTGLELLQAEGATITRHADRIDIEIRMPTPVPGTYAYPDDVPPERQAGPEVFTLWAVVFNHPELCVSSDVEPRCGAEDFTDTVKAGAYNVAAHVSSVDHEGGAFIFDRASGGEMILKGTIHVGDAAREDLPPNADVRHPLTNPLGAEVHLPIAPHGQLDPATVVTELYEPAGGPPCGCWWVATFVP